MNNKKVVFLAATTICIIKANASIVREDIPYQYYRDFAENRGVFKPGATNVKVKLKNGKEEILPVPVPDLSVAASTTNFPGIANLIEGQFTTTCAHNPTNYLETMTFGKGSTFQYKMVSEHDHPNFKKGNGRMGDEHIDFGTPRLHKLVTEVAPLERFDNFPEIYNKDPKRFTALARVGSGRQYVGKAEDANQLKTAYSYLTGGFDPMQDMMIEPVNDQVLIREVGEENRKKAILGSTTTNGDSGSPLFVYDNQDKKWKWLGNVLGAYTSGHYNGKDLSEYDIYSEPHGYINEIMNQYRQDINTAGGTLDMKKGSGDGVYTLGTTEFGGKKNGTDMSTWDNGKNLVLTGGGTINMKGAIHQGAGTLTFKDSYTVKGDNNASWIGGGLDIAEGKEVIWQVKGVKDDSLHKIGKGRLTVAGEGNNEGDLSVGDGTVVLKQQGGHAFNNIEIVSGRPTVRLEGQNQVGSSENITFGYRGGNLDLNGQDMDFKGGIKAYDIGANVANSNGKMSTVTISEKKDSGNSGGGWPGYITYPIAGSRATSGDMVYHGKISDNINTKVASGSGTMLFDGEINTPKGNLSIEKETVLQGHPVIHAYTNMNSGSQGNPRETTTVAEKAKNNLGDNSILTKPVSLTQDDWETRNFKLNEIDLKKNLTIGRNAKVKANKVKAGNNIVNLGSTQAIIDERDGDGLYQKIVKGETNIKTKEDKAQFKGAVEGEGATVNMKYSVVNASINDKTGTINIQDQAEWTLTGNSEVNKMIANGKNTKIDLSIHEDKKWNKTTLTTNDLDAKNQTFELTVYPKAGDSDQILVKNEAKGSGNKLKLDFIDADPNGKDIRDEIILALTPKGKTEGDTSYFDATSELDGFTVYKPNIETRERENNYEWYLKKNDSKEKVTPEPLPDKPDEITPASVTPDPVEPPPAEKPSTPSKPGEPSSPSEPSTPSKPGEPSSPSEPSTPSKPGEPSSPSEPSTPSKPSEPKEREKPLDPSDNPYLTAHDNTDYIRDVKALMNTQEAIFMNENELLTKRLGDIRASEKEAGIWYKVQAHQNDLEGVKLKGKTVEVGADLRKNNSVYGLYGSYSEGKTSIKDGYNDFKYGGVGAYYTYASENGGFLDLVGKYIKTSQRVKLPRAVMDGVSKDIFNKTPRESTDMYMASAQTGIRKTFNNGVFIEPSVKLTAGHMDGYKVKGRDGATAEVKSSNPLYGEAGVQFGKNFNGKNGKRKFSVSTGVHYQQRLGKKGKIILTDKEKVRSYDTMDTDRVVANVSIDGKVTDSLNVYGRVEHSFGGKYKTDYTAQVGFRYTF